MERIFWYFSRWWAHTWAIVRSLRFWVTLAVLLGLFGVSVYIVQASHPGSFSRGYEYMRVGEYKKGWDEIGKAFARASTHKPLPSGPVARAEGLSKSGGRVRPAGDLQSSGDPGVSSAGAFPGVGNRSPSQRSEPDRSGESPWWGSMLIWILVIVAAGTAIYGLLTFRSYEFEFKWRIQGQEYTEKLECKNEEDLRRRLRIRGGELLEVLKKIKMSFSSAARFDPRQSVEIKQAPDLSKDAGPEAARYQPPTFFAGSEPARGRSPWRVHLAWCLTGFYILFVLFWAIWGAVLLFSARPS